MYKSNKHADTLIFHSKGRSKGKTAFRSKQSSKRNIPLRNQVLIQKLVFNEPKKVCDEYLFQKRKWSLMTDPSDVRMVDLHSPAPTANTPFYSSLDINHPPEYLSCPGKSFASSLKFKCVLSSGLSLSHT